MADGLFFSAVGRFRASERVAARGLPAVLAPGRVAAFSATTLVAGLRDDVLAAGDLPGFFAPGLRLLLVIFS
jgi:hypothetical protein